MPAYEGPGALAGAHGAGKENRLDGDVLTQTQKPWQARSARRFTLLSWSHFPWDVIGSAKLATADAVVDDILVCRIGREVFALAKRPAAFSEAEWGELLDAAVASARGADADTFADTVAMFDPPSASWNAT